MPLFFIHAWTDFSPPMPQDKLLKKAVVKLTKDFNKITRENIPWKLVSEYMIDHGGSYFFGYTTVRKRWEYLMITSEDQIKKDRQVQTSPA